MAQITLGSIFPAVGAAASTRAHQIAGASTDGNVRTIATSTAGEVKTQLSGSIADRLALRGLESVVVRRFGPMAAQTTELLLDVPGAECELEAFTMGANSDLARAVIRPYRSDGTLADPVGIPAPHGNNIFSVQPWVLEDCGGENDFFKNTLYDTSEGQFVLAMKRQAKFGNGIRIEVGNQANDERNIAVVAMVFKTRA